MAETVRYRRRQEMARSRGINNLTPGFCPKVTRKLKISSLAATASLQHDAFSGLFV